MSTCCNMAIPFPSSLSCLHQRYLIPTFAWYSSVFCPYSSASALQSIMYIGAAPDRSYLDRLCSVCHQILILLYCDTTLQRGMTEYGRISERARCGREREHGGAQSEHMDEPNVSARAKRQSKARQQEGAYCLAFRDAMYIYLSSASSLHHRTILPISGYRLATSLAYATILMCGMLCNMHLTG